MPLPQRTHIYTIDDIYALPDGQRAELIDGQLYMMAPPTRKHQQILLSVSRKIADYIDKNNGSCEVDIAPFAVFLNADDKNYVEPDISVVCSLEKLTDKAYWLRQTGLLRLSLQAAVEWITIPNFLNIVLPVFGNTGFVILKRTGLLFIILNLKIPQNILFLILLRLGFMKIS